MLFSALFRDTGAITYTPSNHEIQEHLDYLRTHHFLRDEFLERRILSGPARRRRRRRRGRYAKMKKLTPEEVEKLFPKKLYAEWLSSGDDSTDDVCLMRVDVVHDHNSDVSSRVVVPVILPNPTDTETQEDFAVVEMHELHDLRPTNALEDTVSLGVLLGGKGELHFDSGTCAICLETFEEDDIVRGLICGHVFHAECVDPWLTRRRACCAICKRDYYKEENSDGRNNPVREGSTNDENAPHAAGGSNTREPNATGDQGESANADSASPSETMGDPTGNNANENGPRRNTRSETQSSTGTIPYRPTGDDDDDSINYDALRTDPNLQALLQELIPLSERVRVILNEHSDLNLEARGKVIADQKYSSTWKRIFWRLMGISKEDLFHWAVIQVYQSEQRESSTGGNTRTEETGAPAETENSHVSSEPQTESNDGGADSAQNGREDPFSLGNTELDTGAGTSGDLGQGDHSQIHSGPSAGVQQETTSTSSRDPSINPQPSEMDEVDISETHEVAARQV